MPGPIVHAIKQAIVDTLDSVDDIGVVHAFERYAKRTGDLAQLYQWNDQIRGWYVRQVSWRQVPDGMCHQRSKIWEIRGFMSLDDDSRTEVKFDQILEDINAAFNADQTLGGAVSDLGGSNEDGIQLVDSGPVMFSGVLCHGARIRLLTRTFD